MVTFAGVDHVAFTVTDLDVSQKFYTEVFDFVVVMDVGYGRICMHPSTGFTLALIKHPEAPRRLVHRTSHGSGPPRVRLRKLARNSKSGSVASTSTA